MPSRVDEKRQQEKRQQACEMAVQIMSSRTEEPELIQTTWKLIKLFETCLGEGAAAAKREFGPKLARFKPSIVKAVGEGR